MERGPETSGLTPTFWGGKDGCVPLGSSRCSSRSAGLKSRVRGHQQQEVVGPIPRDEGGGGGRDGAQRTARQCAVQRGSVASLQGLPKEQEPSCRRPGTTSSHEREVMWIPATQRTSRSVILGQGSRDSSEKTMVNKRCLSVSTVPLSVPIYGRRRKPSGRRSQAPLSKAGAGREEWMNTNLDMKLKISVRMDSIQLKATVEDVVME